MIQVVGYIAVIVAVNVGFAHVPLLAIGSTGEMWPPLSLAVGIILVQRDFAQRAVGHWVWLAMLTGCAISYFMAAPQIAIASAAAFLTAEVFDWFAYSVLRRPLAERVLWSSVVSGPIDSAVFLIGAGFFGWWALAAMSASKLVAAVALWCWFRRRTVTT